MKVRSLVPWLVPFALLASCTSAPKRTEGLPPMPGEGVVKPRSSLETRDVMQMLADSSRERDEAVALWKKAAEEDRSNGHFAQAAVELLKSRYLELSIPPPRDSSLKALCEGLRWEHLDCSKPDGIYEQASERFRTPHAMTRIKDHLDESCERHVLQEGLSDFVKAIPLSDEHKFAKRFTHSTAAKIFSKFSHELFEAGTPLEIWMGPETLVRKCLPRLGYQGVRKVQEEGKFRSIYEGVLKGEKRLLILGSTATNWAYFLNLEYQLARRKNHSTVDRIITLVPSANPDRFYRELSELWYFYSIGIYQRWPAPGVQFGYGFKTGTGNRFLSEVFEKMLPAPPACGASHEFLLGGIRFFYSDHEGKPREVFFTSSQLADHLTIPLFFIGEVLGKQGVSLFGHWSTAGSTSRKIRPRSLFIPTSFSGFPNVFMKNTLSIDKNQFENSPPETRGLLPKSAFVATEGTLGSIFHSSFEFPAIEDKMTRDWKWSGVDTGAFFLAQGYKSALPSGHFFGQYWITDETLAHHGGEAQEANTIRNRADHFVTLSQKLVRQFFDVSRPLCEMPALQ